MKKVKNEASLKIQAHLKGFLVKKSLQHEINIHKLQYNYQYFKDLKEKLQIESQKRIRVAWFKFKFRKELEEKARQK